MCVLWYLHERSKLAIILCQLFVGLEVYGLVRVVAHGDEMRHALARMHQALMQYPLHCLERRQPHITVKGVEGLQHMRQIHLSYATTHTAMNIKVYVLYMSSVQLCAVGLFRNYYSIR